MKNTKSIKQKRYKFLLEGLKSSSNSLQWKVREWQKTKGTLKMCENGFHCSKLPYDAFSYIQGEILAKVEVQGKHLSDSNKECWEEMRIVKAYKWQKQDNVLFAIFAARLVLKNYEDMYPQDKRPRKAIEATERYIKNPSEKNRHAVYVAVYAVYVAVYAVYVAIIKKCNKWMKDHIKELEDL